LNRQDELRKESHPYNQQYGKDTRQIHEYIEQAVPNAAHASDLPSIGDQEDCDPRKDIEPGFPVERDFVHVT
jgi:hypothetical protein